MIPFNRATVAPRQLEYVAECFATGHPSGDGAFSRRVSQELSHHVGGGRVLLTPSCTDALEMAALLLDLQPGDEVIVPAYTFVSTANAFALLGATPVFADVLPGTMNIDPDSVRECVSSRTRAIVVVHYAGIACDMQSLMRIASDAGAMLIEDNAHGLMGSLHGKPLGSFGDLAVLSFHETKNFSSGEGGALIINDQALVERAEVLRDKGTNRSQFFRGEVDKYTWVDLGSSYLLADPLAAVLAAQLDFATTIQQRRMEAWKTYEASLRPWAHASEVAFPIVPAGCSHPAHLFWMLMPDWETRAAFISHMRDAGIHAVFHYQSLDRSPMGRRFGSAHACPVSKSATDRLVRLPVFSDIRADEVDAVVEAVRGFVP